MRLSAASDERSAVLFFENGRVGRQMLFREFEALLDQVVPVSDFAGRQLTAVYVEVNSRLHVTGAVFFLIGFGVDGMADPKWNVPLKLLLGQASSGPDLGSGPIRLVCRNRCPVAWHQSQLWDPPLGGSANAFTALSQILAENRLRLSTAHDEPEDEAFDEGLDDGLDEGVDDAAGEGGGRPHDKGGRARLARSMRSLRLRLSLLKSEHEEHLARLHCRHREELEAVAQTCAALERTIADERRVNAHLKQALDAQAAEFRKVRTLISSQIAKIEHGEQLGKQLMEDFDATLHVATAELQEQLQRKDLERAQRDAEIERLHGVIEELQQQKRSLQEQAAGGDFLRRMSEAGVSYVAMQPGAGEFRVPHEDIPTYLDSPQEYAARYCYVDFAHYSAWLAHYQQPRCGGTRDNGERCGLPVHRVEAPATFEPGESDRCSSHRESSLTISRIIKRTGSAA